MFRQTKALLLTSVVTATMLLPAVASAATYRANLTADEVFTGVSLIAPGETIRFRFRVREDLSIDTFSISGTGNNTGSDLEMIRFGRNNTPTTGFSTIEVDGTSSAGFGFLEGAMFERGDRFSVFFTDGITDDVGLTLSFRTDPVAAVPLPAAGLLMLPVLMVGGLAAWVRRRRTLRPAMD